MHGLKQKQMVVLWVVYQELLTHQTLTSPTRLSSLVMLDVK
jgi:hypothetical protein